MRKPEILVPMGTKTLIAKDAGCTLGTVTGALSGLRSSELVDKIRDIAIKKYGGAIAR